MINGKSYYKCTVYYANHIHVMVSICYVRLKLIYNNLEVVIDKLNLDLNF